MSVQKICCFEGCTHIREYGLRGGFAQYCQQHFDSRIHVLTEDKKCHYPHCAFYRETPKTVWCIRHRYNHQLPPDYLQAVRNYSRNPKDPEEERILMTAPITDHDFGKMNNQELLDYIRKNLDSDLIKMIRES